jgi:5'-deoxynucleotidase YfbR-like HD superfamily hydrolase
MTSRVITMCTFTGRIINPARVCSEDIDIIDIAHHLSKIDRYNGALPVHYSVAQHSVMVSHLVPREFALWGLLHDGPEYVVGDLVRGVKHIEQLYPIWEPIETSIMNVIVKAFSLTPSKMPQEVKWGDDLAAVVEKRDLCPHRAKMNWGVMDTKFEAELEAIPPIRPLAWPEAKQMFLDRFNTLRRS